MVILHLDRALQIMHMKRELVDNGKDVIVHRFCKLQWLVLVGQVLDKVVCFYKEHMSIEMSALTMSTCLIQHKKQREVIHKQHTLPIIIFSICIASSKTTISL